MYMKMSSNLQAYTSGISQHIKQGYELQKNKTEQVKKKSKYFLQLSLLSIQLYFYQNLSKGQV